MENQDVEALNRILQGQITPEAVTTLNDAAIHAALLAGYSLEQLIVQFASLAVRHSVGIVGIRMELIGNDRYQPQLPPLFHPTSPVDAHQEKIDADARGILGSLDSEALKWLDQ